MASRPEIRSLSKYAGMMLATAMLVACSGQETAAPVPRSAMVVQPVPADLSYAVYPGEVRARQESSLAFQVAGKLYRRHVDVGARVKAGDVLAELDPDDLRLAEESARAQLAAAEADLALNRSELERHRALLERQLISRSLFEARETQFKAAQARLRQAQAQREVAQNQSGYAQLRANADGVIAQRLAETGQVVAAGQAVFVLAANGEREIAISLPEADIGRYQIGQAVLVTPWSNPQQRIPGTLRELSPAADAGARTYAARVQIAGEANGLELGQSARAIFASTGVPALAVPLPAVTADAGKHYVWVVDVASSTVQRREVVIGPFLDEAVPVTEGLTPTDWVVAAGVHLLQPGQAVRPVDRDNRAIALTPAG